LSLCKHDDKNWHSQNYGHPNDFDAMDFDDMISINRSFPRFASPTSQVASIVAHSFRPSFDVESRCSRAQYLNISVEFETPITGPMRWNTTKVEDMCIGSLWHVGAVDAGR
jgi:hypothetical protein